MSTNISTAPAGSASTFEQRQLRDVLGTFVTGVTVVTTCDADGNSHGVTANSFSSVSLDPPLVLWSQALTSKSYPAFRDSEHFAVNILADDQIAISNHFAKSREDKFSGIAHNPGLGGSPVLDGAVAHLECVKVATYPSGDHVVFIGRVERIGHSNRRALAFSCGKYMVAYSHDLGPASLHIGTSKPADLSAIRQVISEMPAIAKQVGHHTLCLAVWGNHGPTAIHWEPSSQPVSEQLRTGLVMSISHSATGRAFAAFLPSEMTRALIDEDLRQLPAAEGDMAARRQRFEDNLTEAKQRGMARSIGSIPSPLHQVAVNAFSVPIFDKDGNMIMALSLTSSAARLAADWDGEVPHALVSAVQEISKKMNRIQ